MATLSGTVPGLLAIGAGIPMKFAGQRQGLAGIQKALSRQIKEQNAIGKQADDVTSNLLATQPPGLVSPATQPYAPAVESRLAALSRALPGAAGVRRPGMPTMQPRLSSVLARARQDAGDNATMGAAQGAEEQRARTLGEVDFQRRLLGQTAKAREALYQQEQDTRAMRGIANRNLGSTLQDLGRSFIQSGGIL